MFSLKQPIGIPDLWDLEYENEIILRRLLQSRESDAYASKLLQEMPMEPQAEADGPIAQYLGERVRQLGRRVVQLTQELQARQDLRSAGLSEIDYQIASAAHSLGEFEFFGIGYNRGVDMKRGLLERQLADLRHKRRQEEHSFWRDLVALRKELREAIAEYEGTLRRLQVTEASK